MKKTLLVMCVGAFLVIFGSYDVSFASSYAEPPVGRSCGYVIDFIENCDSGEGVLLYGEFTVNFTPTCAENDVHVLLKKDNGRTNKHKEQHLLSFQIWPGINPCEVDPETLAALFVCAPYMEYVDESFGLDGVPLLESIVIETWECYTEGDIMNSMIQGRIVIRVAPYTEDCPPES
jgi:hypothetical protein